MEKLNEKYLKAWENENDAYKARQNFIKLGGTAVEFDKLLAESGVN